ncbi:MAG: hypothetical protein IJ086_10645 [Clostridium sp.]|nr:hypothetical protein [Clostridium sp.]
MIKIRLTFIDNKSGNEELNKSIDDIRKHFNVICISRKYIGRNGSKYANIYMDVEVKQ